jgi:outer membrane protein OmpA-like peptidoglycan-associated protein
MWKCKPFGWLWGLPLLALLWLLVFFGERRNIEADLGEHAATRLEDAGIAWAKIDFAGRDGVLTGMAGGVKERDDAIALVEKTWGVRIVDEDIDVVRTASPYNWSARKEGSQLVLDGFVPNREDRKAVLTMAKSQFPGFDIIDNMEIASGEPDHRIFMETVGFGLKQLSGFNFGTVALRDRDFSIAGLTKDVPTYKNLKEALREELPLDTRLVSSRVRAPEVVIPFASPFLWSANKWNNTLRLSGYVHSAAEISNIVATARKILPDHKIINKLQIARGVPTKGQWKRGTAYGFSQLARLERGVVTLSDLDFMIKGHAANIADYADIEKNLLNLPRGFRLAKKELTVPKIDPYVWRADYHARRLTLSGNVPDRETRRDIKAQAKRYFPNSYILDKMEVGPGAPLDWKRATSSSLSQLARLKNGSTMIWNTEIEMRGRATSAEMRTDIRDRMKGELPSTYQFFDEIRVPEPVIAEPEILVKQPQITEYKEDDLVSEEHLENDVCQSYLDSILAGESILFAPASAKFREDSFAVLTRLAHTAKRCPDTRIEIAGHTDSDGSRKFNEFLSLRRARSVVDFLTKQGISKDRLSAIGYGESKPVVPNTSKANKAKNRRIEFKIKEF